MEAGDSHVPIPQRVLTSLSQRAEIPFPFFYGGEPSSQLLPRWSFAQRSRRVDRFRTAYTFLYTDPATGLQVECECTLFDDFSAVEWVLRFRHMGSQDSPILSNIQVIGLMLPGASWSLHYPRGSHATREDFAPVTCRLRRGEAIRLAPIGGRSSNSTAVPFFHLQREGGGVLCAVGWSGQWAAEFILQEGGMLHLRVGQEQTHFKLHSGETVRTPRILLLPWQGEEEATGFNLLRRFLLRYHTPQYRGKPALLPFTCSSCGPPNEANTATEQNQLEFAAHFVSYGVEYLWLDAG